MDVDEEEDDGKNEQGRSQAVVASGAWQDALFEGQGNDEAARCRVHGGPAPKRDEQQQGGLLEPSGASWAPPGAS